MAIQTKLVDYRDDDGTPLQGLLAWDDRKPGKQPAVMVAHQWGGRDALIDGQARKLAEVGYVAFALDVYGKGQRGAAPKKTPA